MQTPRSIRIFLSSPSDVSEERAIVLDVVEQLNFHSSSHGRLRLEVIAWDKPGAGTPMLANMTPQEAINLGLPKPSECDIVVVILWSRMGTPLPKEYTKPDGGRYMSGTEYEYLDALASAKQTNHPVILVYRRMEEALISLRDPSRVEKMQQYERVEAFFESFKNTDGSIKQGHNAYNNPRDFRPHFEGHLSHVLLSLNDTMLPDKKVSAKSQTIVNGSPFPGLRALTPFDSGLFFGRNRETDALMRRVISNRFVVVIGASASGKSSLVGAGLIPSLRAYAAETHKKWLLPDAIENTYEWRGLRFTPGEVGENPFKAFALKLAPLLDGNADDIAAKLSTNIRSFSEHCLKAAVQRQVDHILIFIDQFEEIFTIVKQDLRIRFIEMITQADEFIHIIVTIRADFYLKCTELRPLVEMLEDGSFPLAIPNQGALYAMITRPAEIAGLIYEDGLPERILEDLGNEPGALALMAYTLDELYNSCQSTRVLTFEAYAALGGAKGAIGQRAQAVFNQLDEQAQSALPQVFQNLVSISSDGLPTRRRALLNEVQKTDSSRRLVEAFVNPYVRLLIQDKNYDNDPVVQVAHEALFQTWPTLADWILKFKDDLLLSQQVRQAANEWENSGRNTAFLWPDERLKPVYEMFSRMKIDLDESLASFVRTEADRLIEELQVDETTHQRRSSIGDRLALIGDKRPGVGLLRNGLPDICWKKISSGKAQIQDKWIDVKPFFLAKYPITHIQFEAFLGAPDGFSNIEWWNDMPLEQQNIAEQRYKFLNYPRDSVSWYQAIAFCRWLTHHVLQMNLPDEVLNSAFECEITLPTEWEWQQAATNGDTTKVYPWGNSWDKRKANTSEAGLGKPIATGMYPAGDSEFGVSDMSGNILEWCLNEFINLNNTGAQGENWRALRGGSPKGEFASATCTSRAPNKPYLALHGYGFRVALKITQTKS